MNGQGYRSFPPWLLAAFLGLVTLALYWPAVQCDFINYDDPDYVTTNPHVLAGLTLANIGWAFTTAATGNWHPLTWVSLMLNTSLFGKNAASFHAANLVLHAINAVLLFWLLLRLTGAKWRSALAAAVFAWHPLHVESVAWVAERKDVLSASFGFLVLLFYVRYARSRAQSNPPLPLKPEPNDHRDPGYVASRRHIRLLPQGHLQLVGGGVFYLLSLLAFALGLMCKSMLVTLPCVMLLLDYWPLARVQPGRSLSLVREKIPFFALAATASLVTFLVQQQHGAVPGLANVPLGLRLANALVSYVRYLGKLLWPEHLAIFYPFPAQWPLPAVLSAGALLAGLTLLFWANRRRYPFFIVGWLGFLGMLLPVIGVVQAGQQAMADRYAYLPSVGLLILIVWGAPALFQRWHLPGRVLPVASFACLILCLVLTRQQLRYWHNSETLFRHALDVTSNNYIAHNNLGFAFFEQGRTDDAITEYQAALHDRPDYAESHNNLGVALARQGHADDALREYRAAIQLKPAYSQVRYNLGNLLARQGQADAAIAEFQATIRLEPDTVSAHNNLGVVLTGQGRFEEAMAELQTALRLEPDNADAHYNLGNALLKAGRTDDAVHEFQTSLQLQPDNAPGHYNLGVALNKLGQTDSAIREFQAAIRLQPNYALAHNNLGIALASQGRLDEAITEFQTALRLKPDYASAQSNLNKALALKNPPNPPP